MNNKFALRPERMIILIIVSLLTAFSSFAHDTADCNCEGMTYKIWYLDSDGDGFGDMLNARIGCAQPFRYVENCLDEDDTRHDAAASGEMSLKEWFRDADGDGFGDALQVFISLNKPEGFVADNTDADDNNEMIWFMNDAIFIAGNDITKH